MRTKSAFSDLLAAAREGDGDAQNELHRRYAPQIERRLRRRARNGLRRTHDTEDLAQSVFVEVLRDLPRFEDRGEGAFRSWLAIKADNKVRMKFRKQLDRTGRRRENGTANVPSDIPAGAPGPNTVVRLTEDAGRLRAAMARLRPTDRMVLALRKDRSATYDELAELLGTTAEAARKRHGRALLALKRAWDAL